MCLLNDGRPDLSDAEYTLIISHDVACALIRGEVPQAVRVACISGMKALAESPADGIDSAKRRRSRARKQAVV